MFLSWLKVGETLAAISSTFEYIGCPFTSATTVVVEGVPKIVAVERVVGVAPAANIARDAKTAKIKNTDTFLKSFTLLFWILFEILPAP